MRQMAAAKCVGYRGESRSRAARQSDFIWTRPNQGRQRLMQTRGNGEKRYVIDDVRARFRGNRCLHGIERHARDRRVCREVQVCGIIDWKPFIFPVNRLLQRHIKLSPQPRPRIVLVGAGDGVRMGVESRGW